MSLKIVRTDRRTLSIEIKQDNSVIVRAPRTMKDSEIEEIIQKKSKWIEKHKKRNAENQTGTREQLMPEEIKQMVDDAAQYIPKRVKYYAAMMGVTYGKITIRNQKTRWGSCSAKGNLNFNCQLMKFTEDIIDYVVVHELCHRKEMNHSKKFWSEVEKILPDYRERRRKLKGM